MHSGQTLTSMRLVLGLFGCLALGIGAYGFYWQHRLAPVMNHESVRLVPERLQLAPETGGRTVDLGFAEFRLPETFEGNLERHDDSLFVRVVPDAAADSALIIGPPVFEADPEFLSLLEHYRQLDGGSLRSYRELELEILSAQPFSGWTVPFRGIAKSRKDAILLTLKLLVAAGATRIQIHEDERFQVVIATRKTVSEVKLTEKATHVSQTFMFPGAGLSAEVLASHLTGSYRFKAQSTAEHDLRAELAAAGIEHRVPPAPAAGE